MLHSLPTLARCERRRIRLYRNNLSKVVHLQMHSFCADEPFTTPPPGFVAEAKFNTHTFLAYFA